MSQKYDEYLHEHISNVHKGGEWLIDHDLVEPDVIDKLRLLLKKHDKSKLDDEEYDAYDEYFYGKGKDDPKTAEAFDFAWLRHIHQNPHHWQYWVLINDDDGKNKPLQMPLEYVYEMIADWWSFSWKSGDLHEIFDWYADHSGKMILHESTRQTVDRILDRIETILEEESEGDEDGSH